MIITPNHIAIGRMFEQNFLFEVPKYQRYYAWEDNQVNDFIKDIDNVLLKNTSEHFLGGVVCVSKVVEGSTRQQKELIDGQQRITTSILLIVNIIRKYEELQNRPDLTDEDKEIISSRITKLKEKYINYNDEINRKPQVEHKLVLSLADRQFFESVLSNRAIMPTRDSHEKIAKANQLLAAFIQRKLDTCVTNVEKIDMLSEIEIVLQSKCTVIFMDCDSRASAYKLFQVLNDRGAGLNEGDLLKSKTLEALEDYPHEQEQAQRYWDEILEEEPTKVEGFLRTYFASCCGKRAGRTTLYNDIPNAYVYNPITEIPNDLVWEFLLKGDCRSPWGSDMKYLFSLYQGENLGEEKSVLGEVDREKIPVTGNSRFGCWCCTMVKEDKSLQNFINKGATELVPLREFRNELLKMREDSQYRDSKRRNGSVYKKTDGSFGMGPFTLEARRLILERLLELENKTGMELITKSELKVIDKMWDEEGDLTCRTLVETYHKVKGEKLSWDDYKTPRFDDEAIQAIRDVANKYDIPVELITKLIVSVDTNKHITKNNKMQKAFDSIIGQGWLHYNSVEGALNHED